MCPGRSTHAALRSPARPVFLVLTSTPRCRAASTYPAQITVAAAPSPAAAVVVRSDDAALAEHIVDLLQSLLLSL